MKKTLNWSLRKLLTLCLALGFMFVISSCDDDDKFDPTLISVYTPDYWLGGSYFYYAVASDANGDVITYARLQNGETTTLSSNSYKGKTFTLSIIERYKSFNSNSIDGESFYQIPRGGVVRLDYEDLKEGDNESYLSYAQFNLSNAANPNVSSYSLITDYTNIDVGTNSTQVNVYFKQESSRVFALAYNNNGTRRYTFPSTVYNGFETYPFDLATVTSDFVTEAVQIGEEENAYVYVNGILGTGESRQTFREVAYSSGSGTINVAFPGTAFTSYSSYSEIGGNNFYAYIYDKDSKYNFTHPTYTYAAESTGPQLTYSITGGGDWMYMDIDYDYSIDGNGSYDLDVYLPVGENIVANIVKLPTEITEGMDDYVYEDWEFDFDGVDVVDYEDFANAAEYIRAVSDKNYNYYDYNYTNVEVYTEGGGELSARKNDAEDRFKYSIMPSLNRSAKQN
jgi:hypothetical protein